jgi:hypothetical protein
MVQLLFAQRSNRMSKNVLRGGLRQPVQKKSHCIAFFSCCTCIVAGIAELSKESIVEEMKHASGISGRGTQGTPGVMERKISTTGTSHVNHEAAD